MRAISAVVHHLLRSRANRYPSNIQQGYGHPHRAGVLEGIADADGTGVGYGLRLSCMYLLMYGHHISRVWINRVRLSILLVVS